MPVSTTGFCGWCAGGVAVGVAVGLAVIPRVANAVGEAEGCGLTTSAVGVVVGARVDVGSGVVAAVVSAGQMLNPWKSTQSCSLRA
jgi:hypothetical protein